ncbi:hypothetical protein [Rhizobium sp. NPDC090279]|uniref:hypothetical protein n=1 Tax=Rhizobium sp. NPDC090279 TaxID=3364499 RepID=UPI00383B1FA4
MTFAVWRIWMFPTEARGQSPALVCFYLQLTFNAAWSWAFLALIVRRSVSWTSSRNGS